MTTEEEILDALRETIASVEVAEYGDPIALLVAVSYRKTDGSIVVSGAALGSESGVVNAENAIGDVVQQALDAADDTHARNGRPN